MLIHRRILSRCHDQHRAESTHTGGLCTKVWEMIPSKLGGDVSPPRLRGRQWSPSARDSAQLCGAQKSLSQAKERGLANKTASPFCPQPCLLSLQCTERVGQEDELGCCLTGTCEPPHSAFFPSLKKRPPQSNSGLASERKDPGHGKHPSLEQETGAQAVSGQGQALD